MFDAKLSVALMVGCLALSFAPNSAMAERLPVGEIRPTPAMLAQARRVMPPQGDHDRLIYHFRRLGAGVLVCGVHWGANGGFCAQTSLAEVRQIDERAEDACRQGETGIPHALTGEALVLRYDCVGGHMKREPYAYEFDQDGWRYDEWRGLPSR